ncbi:MAG: hypothetical protein ABJK25_08640 [Halieaceae bacterium]
MSEKRIAIIDDDPFVVAHLKKSLTKRIADVQVVGIIEPVAPAAFDVYIVDKEFHGDNLGQDVVQRIRAIAPESLILAYSAFLDRDYLRALLMEGCEGAFDKGSLEEVDSMLDVIELYFASGKRGDDGVEGFGRTIRAISGLVREWNLRITNNGNAEAKSLGDV